MSKTRRRRSPQDARKREEFAADSIEGVRRSLRTLHDAIEASGLELAPNDRGELVLRLRVEPDAKPCALRGSAT